MTARPATLEKSRLWQHLFEQDAADLPAVLQGPAVWTRGQLQMAAQHLAQRLQAAGLEPGQRVALLFSNQVEFLVAFLALCACQAVAVPLNLQFPPEDAAYVLTHAGCRLILSHPAFAEMLQGVPVPVWMASTPEDATALTWQETPFLQMPDPPGDHPDTRLLIYTSGTTGKPKGVMLGEANLLGNLAGINPVFDFTQADCLLLALPLFHAYGFIIALLALRKAASLVLVPKFTPQALMSALTAQPVTVLPMVPTMFSLLLQASQRTGRAPFERIRFCISGGAALPEALLSQLQDKLGLLVLEGYGLSEASPVVAVNRLDRGTIPGSVGLPLPNVSVTLGEDGEILVEGPNVMLGYFHDAEATAAAMTPAGRLRTGDLGHLDAEGNLYLSGGRKKDLIIKAGENISPVKIEQVLYAHPDVLEASVIGVPHARDGESILACIELKPDVPEDARPSVKDLIQHCRQHLPAFLVPDAVTFLDTLPKNAAGKILKKELRARFHS